MFTGIIEAQGVLVDTLPEGANLRLRVACPFVTELKIDQSVAHNGICLTVVAVDAAAGTYEVVAIPETLSRTNLGSLAPGSRLNLERCLRADARLDGHFVQGHVDAKGICRSVEDLGGSWRIVVGFPPEYRNLLVPKGSVALNGISLTVVEAADDWLSVAIIPYTWEHTNLGALRSGDPLNLEFDILGKYVARMLGK